MKDRHEGAGPFAVRGDIDGDRDVGATVLDGTGAPFAYVRAADCHGSSNIAARVRALRIAETLNRVERHDPTRSGTAKEA